MRIDTKVLEEFELSIDPLLPAYLAIFDLAGTKIRNLYLGHQEVDKDIEFFNNLLKSTLSKREFFKRIAGDKWIACVTEQQLYTFNEVISAYVKELVISVSWKCRGLASNGNRVLIENKTNILLARAVRCGYLSIRDINQTASKVNELVEKVWYLPVNLATSLEQDLNAALPNWKCIVGDLPGNDEYCPSCNSKEFNWCEGTGDSNYGTCKQCGAKVDFSYG